MLRRLAWGIVPVAFLVGVARPALCDTGLSGFNRFNGGPPTVPPPDKPKPRIKPADADKKPSDTAAALRAQEEANLLRRLAVCDRLKQLALEQGDSALEQQAIRLEERATEVFRQRTKHLGASKPAAEEGGQR